jgi:hypothetical protein
MKIYNFSVLKFPATILIVASVSLYSFYQLLDVLVVWSGCLPALPPLPPTLSIRLVVLSWHMDRPALRAYSAACSVLSLAGGLKTALLRPLSPIYRWMYHHYSF